jgi:hypothetical protein
MATCTLTEYVMRLTRDPEEFKKFEKSKASAKEAMTAAGVKPEHQQLLLDRKPHAITQAMTAESPHSEAQGAMYVMAGFTINSVTHVAGGSAS